MFNKILKAFRTLILEDLTGESSCKPMKTLKQESLSKSTVYALRVFEFMYPVHQILQTGFEQLSCMDMEKSTLTTLLPDFRLILTFLTPKSKFLLHLYEVPNHTVSRKYRKITHVEASTEITHPFARAENKTLLLIVNVIQEKYDSSSKQVKIIGFSVFNTSCLP
jgi:hypothetical protein